MIGGAGFLGKTDQRLRGGAHLGHRAGCRFDRVGPHGLDGIDHDQPWHGTFRQGRHDVLDGSLRGELHRRVRQAQPLGAQPDLRHGLLAGDIDRAMTGPRHQRGCLRQQRRLADAGIAADQQYRAAHKSAAGDAVEFGHARGQARGLETLPRQRLQRKQPPLALAADRDRHRGRARILLGKGIPLAAGFALALPAIIGRAAVLTDE